MSKSLSDDFLEVGHSVDCLVPILVTIDIRYNHDLFCHAVCLSSEVRISWLVVHFLNRGIFEMAELDDAVGVDRDQVSTPTIDSLYFLHLIIITPAVRVGVGRTVPVFDLDSNVTPWSVYDDVYVVELPRCLGQRFNAFPPQKLDGQVP